MGVELEKQDSDLRRQRELHRDHHDDRDDGATETGGGELPLMYRLDRSLVESRNGTQHPHIHHLARLVNDNLSDDNALHARLESGRRVLGLHVLGFGRRAYIAAYADSIWIRRR